MIGKTVIIVKKKIMFWVKQQLQANTILYIKKWNKNLKKYYSLYSEGIVNKSPNISVYFQSIMPENYKSHKKKF